MSIHDRMYQPLECVSWSDSTKTGVIKDSTGYEYPVTLESLSAECDGCLFAGEACEGFIVAFDKVEEVQPADLCERKSFDSVGAAPDLGAITPVVPDTHYCPGVNADANDGKEISHNYADGRDVKISWDYAEGVSHTQERSAIPVVAIEGWEDFKKSVDPALKGCRSCGKELAPAAQYCHRCGKKV